MAIVYFDSNVSAAISGGDKIKWRTEDILAAMDRVGIGGALMYAGWLRTRAPENGNDRLLEELEKGKGRLFGCYAIAPESYGFSVSPDDLVTEMRTKGMKAAVMFPRSNGYAPDEKTMGTYYSALEKANIPLIVDGAEMNWYELEEVLSGHPALNVIYVGASWAFAINLIAYMKKYPNLYTDLSSMQANYLIEALVKEFGAERIVFGTGLPMKSPGAARAFIDYAMISDEEKRLIAGENLARLCGMELPSPAEVNCDYIAKEASEGKPLSDLVLDSHAHFIDDNDQCGGGVILMLNGDLEHMALLSEKMGVDGYCVAPWLAIWTDSEAGNEIALKMAKRDSRVYPYLLIDPNYVEDVKAVVDKYQLGEKFPGMKMFRSRIRRRYNDPVFDYWWKVANEKKIYALLDSGSYPEYLSDMAELAEKYPEVSIFLDHAGRDFATAEAYAALAKKYENVYLQLTYTSVPEGVIEYLCKEGLAHKTMYGTDAPMRDPRPQMGWVAYADISVEDKRLILGGNMKRVLDRNLIFNNVK